jgi:hypothetical protein
VSFREKGGWLNYADGLGSPESKCPWCGEKTPTGRKYWYDMSFPEKLRTYSKMLLWFPLGIVAGGIGIYFFLTTSNANSHSDPAMDSQEFAAFVTNDPIIFLLFAITISLSLNITSMRMAIRSKTPKRRGW